MESIEQPGASPFEQVFRSVIDHASAKLVYGEPFSVGGKTILPVARIRYGFGGGSGGSPDRQRHGGGGGGGLVSHPVGVVEVTAAQTRFIPINPVGTTIAGIGVGICIGCLAAYLFGARR